MSGSWTVCLGVMLLLLPRTGQSEGLAGDACDLPNLRMPRLYRTALQPLVARSATLRRQCNRLAMAAQVRVTIEQAGALVGVRARSRITRGPRGTLDVVMELPLGRELPELMGHELEHVLEQIDGLDLARLAREGAGGVVRVSDAAFETVRAQRAGRQAALEAMAPQPRHQARTMPPASRVLAD